MKNGHKTFYLAEKITAKYSDPVVADQVRQELMLLLLPDMLIMKKYHKQFAFKSLSNELVNSKLNKVAGGNIDLRGAFLEAQLYSQKFLLSLHSM